MTYTIEPTSAETTRGCAALALKSLPPSRFGLVLIGIYVLTFVATIIFVPEADNPAFLIAVATATVALLAMQAETRSRVARGRKADPHALETYQVELSAAGIRTWCAHMETRYTWDAMSLMANSPEFLLFVHGVGGGVFLPKRLLSPEELDRLRADVKAWAPSLREA